MAIKPGLAEFMRDHYEENLKAANYLFAAHGAGLAGCLSVLKDYNPESQLRGLGIFVVIFGFGFIGAILNYIGLFFARILTVNAIFEEKEIHQPSETVVGWIHFIGLGIALLTLFGAVIGLMFRFAHL
jgi:hypothetical protein